MPKKKITDLFVQKVAPPPQGRIEYFDLRFPGLALRVTHRGHKSWCVFYRTGGRQRRYTIGTFTAFGVADARRAASEALRRVEAGGDPADDKKARLRGTVGADTFAVVAQEYLDRYVQRNTAASTFHETERILQKDVIPAWGKRPIGTIARRDVIKLIDDIAARGAEVQANRVLARLRTLFGWAVEKDKIQSSPCDGLKPPTKETSRDRVLSDDELRLVWHASDYLGWPFGPLFKLLLLTAQRRDEVATMEWQEIDLDARVWTIPKHKAKNKTLHDVQLSRAAIDVLKSLPHMAGGLVFTTNAKTAVSGFSRAKERLDAEMARILAKQLPEGAQLPAIEPWILHDLRRTAATGMARLNIAPHVVDRVLNHQSGTIRGVAKVYNRFEYGEERRSALEAWGRYVEENIIGIEPGHNIVKLRSPK